MSGDPCPCGSGLPYRACCGVYHRGEAEAPDAEALMRSRYAAFARKEAAYLWRTLHPDHDDRSRPEREVLRALGEGRLRYMGLRVLDRALAPPGELARVLFHARVFDQGRDLSFVELSDFLHDGEGWRYLAGLGAPAAAAAGCETIAAFERRFAAG
jgi:SEC-C motif-containing protein